MLAVDPALIAKIQQHKPLSVTPGSAVHANSTPIDQGYSPISIVDEILAKHKVVRNPVDSNALHDSVHLVPALGALAFLRRVHDTKLDLVVKTRAGWVCKYDLGGRNGALDSRACTGNRTSRSCSRDEGVQPSSSLVHDLGASTTEVCVVVGRVFELVCKEATRTGVDRLAVRRGVRAKHIVRSCFCGNNNIVCVAEVDVTKLVSSAAGEVLKYRQWRVI